VQSVLKWKIIIDDGLLKDFSKYLGREFGGELNIFLKVVKSEKLNIKSFNVICHFEGKRDC
jgi:hypothetical protein